jgi:hypothetical protein
MFSFISQNRQFSLSNLTNLANQLQRSVSNGVENSCQALADFAQVAAGQDGVSKDAFVNDFQVLTPNLTVVKLIPGVYGTNQYVNLNTKGLPTGFAPQFVDSQIPNSDQGHHFAAYFQLGYVWTALSGKVLGPVYEFAEGLISGASTSNPGDVNLANAAAGLGWELRTGALAPADVSAQIRQTICAN